MNPQVVHPRSFQTAAKTPNQCVKIVLEGFRLVEEILDKKAWPGPSFSAASHPPPSPQGSKKLVQWVLPGVGVESYKGFLPVMPEYLPQGEESGMSTQTTALGCQAWQGGACTGLCLLMQQREGDARALELGPGPGHLAEQGYLSSPIQS